MTWGELKLACLLEMGDATTLAEADPETIARMPTIANAGLQRLATVGRYIKNCVEFSQTSLNDTNLVSGGFSTVRVDKETTITAAGAKAYYFEVNNPCTVRVIVDGVLFKTITNTVSGKFTAYRGLVSGETVSLVFAKEYPYSFRNVCLYSVSFPSDADVQDYSPYVVYDLNEIAPGMFRPDVSNIAFQSGEDPHWINNFGYEMLPQNMMKVSSEISGNFRIPYFAYPDVISQATTDNTVITCEIDGLELLKYYMCYHLYKGDDVTLATQWHNDFEEGLGAGQVDSVTARVIVEDRYVGI